MVPIDLLIALSRCLSLCSIFNFISLIPACAYLHMYTHFPSLIYDTHLSPYFCLLFLVCYAATQLGIQLPHFHFWDSRRKMAKIEFLMKRPPWPSASETKRQTGWALHHRGWSNDACATLQATALRVSMNLDGFLEQTASSNWFGRENRRGSKSGRQMTVCTMLEQDSI